MLAEASVAVVLLVLATGTWRATALVIRSLEGIEAALEAMTAGPEEGYRTRIAELEHAVDLLPQRWEEMVHAAKRSENRTRALIRDARRELGESGIDSPALEAAAGQLRLLDDDGGGGEAVPAVHQNMESTRPAAPDWRTAGLMKKFGG